MPRVSTRIDKFLKEEALTAAEQAAFRDFIEAGHIVSKTTAEWEGVTLANQAIGIVTDVSPRTFKIGDGVTVWADLPFAGGGGGASTIGGITGLQEELDGKMPAPILLDAPPVDGVTTAGKVGQHAQLPGSPDRWWIAETLTTWREIAENTSTILAKLQGVAADPTRIGAEHLPATQTYDYITLGELDPAGTYPQGTVGRIGDSLRLVDSGGVQQTIGGGSDVNKPFNHVAGLKLIIPHEIAGSTMKYAAAGGLRYFWDEITRVTLPGETYQVGNTISIDARVRHVPYDLVNDYSANTNISLQDMIVALVPAATWEEPTVFGDAPSNTMFTTGFKLQTKLHFPYRRQNSLDTISNMRRSHLIVSTTAELANIGPAEIDTNQWGYNKSLVTGSPGAWTDNETAGSQFSSPIGQDLEFVLVCMVATKATSAEIATFFREMYFDIKIVATP